MIELHLIWQILHGWNFLRNKKIHQKRIMQLEKWRSINFLLNRNCFKCVRCKARNLIYLWWVAPNFRSYLVEKILYSQILILTFEFHESFNSFLRILEQMQSMFVYRILIRFVKFTAYYLENISISSRIMQSRKTGAKSLDDVPY